MRLRIAELLKANARKGVEPSTASQLSKMSKGRLSMSTAARLSRDDWKSLPRDVLITLCELLDVGPDELLDYTPGKAKRGERGER
jgi:DNA-binding Xre family transcriptional regulator